jgi:two-component system phosphate regulon sensor histidine kinase PhoR
MKARYFPWRLFRKFFLSLVVLLNVSFIATLAACSYILDFQFYRQPTFIMIFVFFIFSAAGSALFAYRFAQPLRTVILKALRLANKKLVADFVKSEEDLFEDEPGEYFELEQALDKIRKKLKKRRTELAHEREESEILMSFLQDAVISVSTGGKVNFFNSRFVTLFLGADRVKSPAEGTPLVLTDIFRDPELLERVENSLRNGVVERFQQKLRTVLESQGRYFSVAVSPLREEKTREIYGALLLFHDISDFKKAEQIRMEFVQNASHELRTPLTSIKGYLETAREDLAQGRSEQVPQFLGIISKSVDRLSNLVDDMLTLSSLENSSGVKRELVHPEIVTQDVFERLSPLASEKKILLKLVNEATEFKADPVLVEQVLENLIGNAIKYIPVGGRVDVHWGVEKASRAVVLSVKDNGPGIAEEHLDRLFERFYRVDKSRSREVGGTGLGLAIVKHIMQSHGGQVQVRSKAGEGAEFICEFPIRS